MQKCGCCVPLYAAVVIVLDIFVSGKPDGIGNLAGKYSMALIAWIA